MKRFTTNVYVPASGNTTLQEIESQLGDVHKNIKLVLERNFGGKVYFSSEPKIQFIFPDIEIKQLITLEVLEEVDKDGLKNMLDEIAEKNGIAISKLN